MRPFLPFIVAFSLVIVAGERAAWPAGSGLRCPGAVDAERGAGEVEAAKAGQAAARLPSDRERLFALEQAMRAPAAPTAALNAFLQAFHSGLRGRALSASEAADIPRIVQMAADDRRPPREVAPSHELARWTLELWGAPRTSQEAAVRNALALAIRGRGEIAAPAANGARSDRSAGKAAGEAIASIVLDQARRSMYVWTVAASIESALLHLWEERSAEFDLSCLETMRNAFESAGLRSFALGRGAVPEIRGAASRAVALRSSRGGAEQGQALRFIEEFAIAVERMALGHGAGR